MVRQMFLLQFVSREDTHMLYRTTLTLKLGSLVRVIKLAIRFNGMCIKWKKCSLDKDPLVRWSLLKVILLSRMKHMRWCSIKEV